MRAKSDGLAASEVELSVYARPRTSHDGLRWPGGDDGAATAAVEVGDCLGGVRGKLR